MTEDASQRKAGRWGREARCLDIFDSEVTGCCGRLEMGRERKEAPRFVMRLGR